ncbi:MAG: serine protease [bacterium]
MKTAQSKRLGRSIARIGRSTGGEGIEPFATCFRIVGHGRFLGARHYLHSNDISAPEQLAIREASGRVLPVKAWKLSLPGDLAIFETDGAACDPLELDLRLPRDGADLVIVGYPQQGELEWIEGPVSGWDTIKLGEGIEFDGFFVDCEAKDGMSGSPALDPKTGAAVAVLSGINPDLGIAAFCPLPSHGWDD